MTDQIIANRYKIEGLIAETTGKVYRAWDREWPRSCAVKVISLELSRNTEHAERFRREVESLGRAAHPNVVAIYDKGQLPDGRWYLVTEWIDGQRLDELIAAGPALILGAAVRLLIQLCGAVHHAFQRGVLHRDLRPKNLMVVNHPTGEVLKVMDFGLAKLDVEDTLQPSISGSFFRYGSPFYLAPEVVGSSATVDIRSEVYAICCIGYELLTGRRPFDGPRPEIQHVRELPSPPSCRNRRALIPTALDEIILRGMEKDPRRRFEDAGELGRAFEALPALQGGRLTGRNVVIGVALKELETVQLDARPADNLVPLTDDSVRQALLGMATRLRDHHEVRRPSFLAVLARVDDLEAHLAYADAALERAREDQRLLDKQRHDREAALRATLDRLARSSRIGGAGSSTAVQEIEAHLRALEQHHEHARRQLLANASQLQTERRDTCASIRRWYQRLSDEMKALRADGVPLR